jgi:DnaJ-class molecular chaperone
MPGLGGGAAGDALVEITVEPHPAFRVDGDDVRAEIPVTLAEAILGGRVLTETIDGPVRVTIPEGSNTGTTLRLKGKGLAKDGNKRGDHFAVLKILLPARSDPELVEFIRAWSSKRPYSVRDESADEADPEARANPVKDKTQ